MRAAARSPRAPRRGRAGRRCAPRSPRASTAAAGAGRRPAPRSRGRAAAAARPPAPIVPAPPVTRTRLTRRPHPARGSAPRSRRRRRTPAPAPKQFQGSTTRQSGRARSSDGAQRRRPAELRVVRRHDDDVGARRPPRRATRRASRTCGSWTATSASSRSSRRISLWASESRSSSVSRLEGQAEHRDLAAAQRPPSRRLMPSTRNSGTDSFTRETASSMPGACERSSENAKSLRRHVPAVRPGLRDPAAGVVAVDEVDDLEDVRAVLLAVHHQQVGQREVRVAQDVRPDLRQLGLDRRGLHDRRAEDLEQLAPRRSPERSPTPPMMHGSVSISSRKRPAAMRSGAWATNTSSPTPKPRCLAR